MDPTPVHSIFLDSCTQFFCDKIDHSSSLNRHPAAEVLASLSYKFLFIFIPSLYYPYRARTNEGQSGGPAIIANRQIPKLDQSSSKIFRTMSPNDIIRTFFLSLCNFIFTFDGDPNISPAMMEAFVRLRDALRAHEVALNILIPLESSETDEAKRFPLSQCLYRGWHTNTTIVSFIMDCLDTKRHPGGIRKKRMRAVFLATQIEIATSELQVVIDEYKSASEGF